MSPRQVYPDRTSAVLAVLAIIDGLGEDESLHRVSIGAYHESVQPGGWWWSVGAIRGWSNDAGSRKFPAVDRGREEAKRTLIEGGNDWPKAYAPQPEEEGHSDG